MAKPSNGKTYTQIKAQVNDDLGFIVFCSNYGYNKNSDAALVAYQEYLRMWS